MRFSRTLLLSTILALTPSLALAGEERPTDAASVAEAFCAAREAGDDQATLALASASLAGVIAEALARNARVQESAPDEKPPLGDGIPWQAFPDQAPTCTPGKPDATGTGFTVGVTYSFPDQPLGSWTDVLRLVPDGDRLAVDDVWYPQAANDASRPSLRRLIFDSFDL